MLIPGLVLMGILFTVLGAYPFIERWITGDRAEHHLLERPRNQPTRTALGVAGITAYGLLWAEGGNDIIAIKFHLSVETITWFMRVRHLRRPGHRLHHRPALGDLTPAA